MRHTFVAFTLVTATFVSGTAFAGKDPAARAQRIVEKLDANKDGRVSRSEVEGRPRLTKHFADIDANKDGQLTVDELAAAIRRRHEPQQP
jgi:Ca2+-binding EF-hand superfamily protein